MQLQTNIPFEKQAYNLIDYDAQIVLFGSCFAENISNKLDYFKFQNTLNPFGILFHPLAIESLITKAINEKVYTKDDIFFHNEQWHCYDTHSKLSDVSDENLLDVLNNRIKTTRLHLESASHIILTLGTAWTYRNIATDAIVANCHKVPQKQFLKEFLSVEAISESLAATICLVKSVNPSVSIIFTVSPIRHLKDGFVENSQSKAHLISGIHDVVNPREQLYYFPAYEIMMDELRDYRFYAEDMLHPNRTAIQYIWNKFQDVWISDATSQIMDDVESVQKGMQHKAFNQDSVAHQQFLRTLETKKTKLQDAFAHIRF